MVENYVESIIIRQDGFVVGEEPSFSDEQVDAEFEFKGTIKLIQILKSVQNASHDNNKHDYVFKIVEIKKIKENK